MRRSSLSGDGGEPWLPSPVAIFRRQASGPSQTSGDSERRLTEVQDRLKHLAGSDSATWRQAFDELHTAEREVAAARGEQYAEVIDIGGRWDVGAPLPHVIAGASSAFVVCHAHEPDPSWDGTYVTMVSPNDSEPSLFLVIELVRCRDIRLGGPNDEALHGHPLHGKGLEGYQAHEIFNSEWIEQEIDRNSVHPHHSDEPFRLLHHYVLAFHDEMVEALSRGIQCTHVRGTMRSVMSDLVERVTT